MPIAKFITDHVMTPAADSSAAVDAPRGTLAIRDYYPWWSKNQAHAPPLRFTIEVDVVCSSVLPGK